MNKYDSSLYFALKSEDKEELFRICEEKGTVPSRILRMCVKKYIRDNGELKWD